VGKPFWVIIGDTRISSPTAITVSEVRQAWEADRLTYEKIFDHIRDIVLQAKETMETGEVEKLGGLMNRNHEFLRQINVSSPELERNHHRCVGKQGAWGQNIRSPPAQRPRRKYDCLSS
jgi:mevalonate kinase